ncbi:MAG TPA: TlpA disulfide reductase family protein [Telluria sp.]|nr:TlpA disulfide reductase family protein [Telluria sp.]
MRKRLLAPMLGLLALAACGRAPAPAAAPATPVAAAPAAAPVLTEGKPFPAFMLDYLAKGQPGAALRGKMIVLNVWATWCPPCRREMPGLDRLSRLLDRERVAVVGMSTDDDSRLAAEFLQQRSISFANYHDEGAVLAKRLGLEVYPETFVIAADGTLLARMTGLQDWDKPEVIARLRDLERTQQKKAI